MASTTANEKVAELTALASELQSCISQATLSESESETHSLSLNDNTLQKLGEYLVEFPFLVRTGLPGSSRRDLDSQGTGLWNSCARLMSMSTSFTPKQGNSDVGSVMSRVNAFAFGMLELASGNQGDFRVLKVALKAARVCLDNDELHLGLRILETAAARLAAIEKSGTDVSVQPYIMEYYLLRTYLSWLQGRLDVAELMFSKVPEGDSEAERAAILDICYTVGKSAVATSQHDLALKWLERAVGSNELLNCMSTVRRSNMATDMRLCVLYTLARAYLRVNTADSWYRLLHIMDVLIAGYRNVFAVALLQLEVLSREPGLNVQGYYESLRNAIRIMDFTDESLDLVNFYISKLKNWSLELASKALQQLLLYDSSRLNRTKRAVHAFVTFVYLITDIAFCPHNGLQLLIDTVIELDKSWQWPLKKEATNACFILIWRKIDTMVSCGDFRIAGRWCQVASGDAFFQNGTDTNRAKFQRMLMVCALEDSNLALARETWELMSEERQSEPLTLYLRYKLALLEDDFNLANATQELLHQLGASGTDYVLSCVAEARRMGKTRQAIQGLQYIVENFSEGGGYKGIHTPGIFQSVFHLLLTELGNHTSDSVEIIEQVANVLEAALKEASKQDGNDTNASFSPVELEWLFRTSYNTALRFIKKAPCELVTRLLNATIRFIHLYEQTPRPEPLNADRHFLLCVSLKLITIAPKARIQKALYREIRTCAQDFRTRVSSARAVRNTETGQPGWEIELYRTVLSFDFEAAVRLEQWDALACIIDDVREIADDKLVSVFTGCILSSSSQLPAKEAVRAVRSLIPIISHPNSTPYITPSLLEKLPRYFRCLFQLCIDSNAEQTSDIDEEREAIAESILDHSLALAKQYRRNNPNIKENDNHYHYHYHYHYPDDELEWLATVAFNHAIDLYLLSAESDCKRWAGKAIELADLVQGALGQLLRGNFVRLIGGVE